MAKGRHAYRKGERVSWRSHGSNAVGRVKRRLTHRARAGGQTVESEKPGHTPVHRPQTLWKRRGHRS